MQVPQRVNSTEIEQQYQKRVVYTDKVVKVDAEGLYYRDLNNILRALVAKGGIEKIVLNNVCGQRYIGTDLNTNIDIDVYGTPGNDLAAFLNGPRITIHGNAQDASGNTMNEGEIVIHGRAGRLNRAQHARRTNIRQRIRRLPRWHPHETVRTKSPNTSRR